MGAGFTHEIGWAQRPVLSASEVEAILALCHRLLALPESQRNPRDKPFAGTRHLFALDERVDEIRKVVERPALTEVVHEIVGFAANRVETSYRCPQPSYGGQKLHADDVPLTVEGPNTVATAIIALTDFTTQNGATRLVPGSHRRMDLQRLSGSLDSHADETVMTGPAGTAFIFSGHVLHSGTTNHSETERPALQVVWRVVPEGSQ